MEGGVELGNPSAADLEENSAAYDGRLEDMAVMPPRRELGRRPKAYVLSSEKLTVSWGEKSCEVGLDNTLLIIGSAISEARGATVVDSGNVNGMPFAGSSGGKYGAIEVCSPSS